MGPLNHNDYSSGSSRGGVSDSIRPLEESVWTQRSSLGLVLHWGVSSMEQRFVIRSNEVKERMVDKRGQYHQVNLASASGLGGQSVWLNAVFRERDPFTEKFRNHACDRSCGKALFKSQ